MRVSCPDCKNLIQIDDAKAPTGVFRTPCPNCGKIVTVQKDATRTAAPPSSPHVPAASGQAASPPGDEISPAVQAYVRRELAATKKEILDSVRALFGRDLDPAETALAAEDSGREYGAKRALICDDDQGQVDGISRVLSRLGYSVEVARSAADAIQEVSSGTYQLITVGQAFPDDPEGGIKIIAKINGQKPVQRRQTLVVLISSTLRTGDANTAFLHGANVTVNKADLPSLEPLICESLQHFKQLYAMFNRVTAEKEERG
ncbi:MAG: response regulator [Acidobacteriota bacterium]